MAFLFAKSNTLLRGKLYAANAAFACSASCANAAGSCTAISANTLRSNWISAFDKPLMN